MNEIEKKSNLTFINLGECGENLKTFYNLKSNENLYIASFETSYYLENRVTSEFEYEIYLKNGSELKDLSSCNNESFSVSSSIYNFDMINYDEAKIFNMQGYNIYNLSSDFYTDICSGAYINENDIVIKDRIEYIYPKNVSFCSNGCELYKVEIESKRIECNCKFSYSENNEEINNNKTKLDARDDNFLVYLLDSLNYKIFRCYKILTKLKFKVLLKNTGFFFGIGFSLLNIICCFIFSYHYLPQLRIQIYKLLPRNNDLLKGKKNEIKAKRNKGSKNEKYSKNNLSRNSKIKIKNEKTNSKK